MVQDLQHLDQVWGQRCREENPCKTRGMRHLLHLQYLFYTLEENEYISMETPPLCILLWNGPQKVGKVLEVVERRFSSGVSHATPLGILA